MSSETKLIFQGVKFYWRTRNTLDVTIVDHVEHQLTEVILYDPSLGKEAPRIYLSSTALSAKLDHDDIEYQLSFAKRNSVPITEKSIEAIVNKAKSEYILSRLVITEYSVETNVVIVVCRTGGDSSDLLCEMPPSFVPFQAVHYQQLMAGAVDLAIGELKSEQAKLHTECDQAVALEKIAENSTRKLSAKQRWRIPIVFIKISDSKRLSASDAKILSAVAQNMKTEEDATRMSAVLTRATSHRGSGLSISPTAASSRDVSLFGSQQVVSPCATPRHQSSHSVSQSKLHQATAATRHRAEANHGAHGRQSSFRQGDSGAHGGTDGPSMTLKASSKDEGGESSYNKRRAGSKAPKSPKKSSSKNSGTHRSTRKPLLSALRRLSLSLTSSATASDDVTADGSASGAEAEADAEGQSALQRMISSLGALNNSLRSSFLGTLSGKSGKSGNTASSATTEVNNQPEPVANARPSTAENTPVDGVAIAIQQATAGAARVTVTAHLPRANIKGADVPADGGNVTQKPQPHSHAEAQVLAQAQQHGCAHFEPATATSTANSIAATVAAPTTTAAASAEFTIQGFFSGLVHWRSTNKIYVDGGGAVTE